MQVFIGTVRRRSRLLALATLTALLALAALSVAQVQAQTPAADTRVIQNPTLSIIVLNDSDNVVAPGDKIEFRLAVEHTTLVQAADSTTRATLADASWAMPSAIAMDGWVRVTGLNMEFDGVSGAHNATRVYLDNNVGATRVPTNAVINNVPLGELDMTDLWTTTLGSAGGNCSWRYIDGDFTATCVVPDWAWASGDRTTTGQSSRLAATATERAPLTITVPRGTPDGSFTISASITLDGGTIDNQAGDGWENCAIYPNPTPPSTNCPADIPLTTSRTFTVGTVDEVADVSLGFATNIAPTGADTYGPATDLDADSETHAQGLEVLSAGTAEAVFGLPKGPVIALNNNSDDDVAYPDSIKAGQSTNLTLRILNENNGGAKAGSVSVVILTTTRGTLSLGGGLAGCATPATSTCTIQGSALHAMNSGSIGITLNYPGSGVTAGTATVEARVIAGAETHTRSVDVTFVGSADSLATSATNSVMLNVDAGDDSATDTDGRDQIRFNVAARDAGDNPATLDRLRVVRITGPDNRAVTEARIARSIGAVKTDGSYDVTLSSQGTAAQPLASGEYTVRLSGSGKTADFKFTVVGKADSVTIGEIASDLQPGDRVEITAAVVDADGNAVVNGTDVTIVANTIGSGTTLVAVGATTAKSVDGSASVTYLVAGYGSFYVSATADGKSDVSQSSIAAGAVAPAEQESPSAGLTQRNPGYTTWGSDTSQKASAVLADLSGFRSILLAQGTEWLRYGIVDGRPIPGSFDFQITRNSILWLAR